MELLEEYRKRRETLMWLPVEVEVKNFAIDFHVAGFSWSKSAQTRKRIEGWSHGIFRVKCRVNCCPSAYVEFVMDSVEQQNFVDLILNTASGESFTTVLNVQFDGEHSCFGAEIIERGLLYFDYRQESWLVALSGDRDYTPVELNEIDTMVFIQIDSKKLGSFGVVGSHIFTRFVSNGILWTDIACGCEFFFFAFWLLHEY